jgi:hypothetical protein
MDSNMGSKDKRSRKVVLKKPGFSLRRLVSISAFFSFLGLGATGIALFTSPPGRIARWGSWRIAGLNKSTYEDIHMVLALLFIIAGTLHLYYNWSPFVSYLRNAAKRLVLITREFTVALGITILLVVSAIWAFPPASYLFDLSGYLQMRHERIIGTPPYGRAEEASLMDIAARLDVGIGQALSALEPEGISVHDPLLSLREIAESSEASPSSIYKTLSEIEDKNEREINKRRETGKRLE